MGSASRGPLVTGDRSRPREGEEGPRCSLGAVGRLAGPGRNAPHRDQGGSTGAGPSQATCVRHPDSEADHDDLTAAGRTAAECFGASIANGRRHPGSDVHAVDDGAPGAVIDRSDNVAAL